MLTNFYIKNYRNLQELKIGSLGRVNLIIGKNNTGKSALLESLAVYATNGALPTITQFLIERGENLQRESSSNPLQANLRLLSSLFSNRNIDFDNQNAIILGTSDENKILSLGVVRFVDEIVEYKKGVITRLNRRIIKSENDLATIPGEKIKTAFEVKLGEKQIQFHNIEKFFLFSHSPHISFLYERNLFIPVVSARNFGIFNNNAYLWDSITLTEKEQYVIEALKIIDRQVERVAFVGDSIQNRYPVVKLSGSSNVLPLRAMGDGINRILTIILALVNAENNYLLIDEFENGLHYSVQEHLWQIIFSLAEKLNIQVFATTHSSDCIKAFEKVLNSNINYSGKVIRLENVDGTIRQVGFDRNEIQIAAEQDIEIR